MGQQMGSRQTAKRGIVKLIVIGAVLGAICASQAQAFQNEPTGFRGVEWGTLVGKAPGLYLHDHAVGDRVSYRRSFEDLSINGIPLVAVYYDFYRGRFEEAVLVSKIGAGEDLLRTFAARYGTASQVKGRRHQFFWKGDTATVVLNCSGRYRTCTAVIASNAMLAEDRAGVAATARDSKDF